MQKYICENNNYQTNL